MMRSTTRGRDEGSPLLAVDVEIDPSTARFLETPFGMVIELDGFSTSGSLGGPGLPSRIIRVALPPHRQVHDLRWDVKSRRLISHEPVFVAPVQLPQPGVDDDNHWLGNPPGQGTPGEDDPQEDQEQEDQEPDQAPPEDESPAVPPPAPGAADAGQDSMSEDEAPRRPSLRPSSTTIVEEPLVEPLPRPPFVAPRADAYQREVESPRPAARLVTTEQIGLTSMAVIEINPVYYDQDGALHLITGLEIILGLATAKERPVPQERIASRAQAARLVEMAKTLVINPDSVWDIAPFYPELVTGVDYLIVTDDTYWDAVSISPAGSAGELVAEFERLAAWKRRRGLRSRVVTITDIVAGRWGNFTAGARDLQEVVRRFLRWAHEHWGVAWLLIGGDVGILPMRRVPGAAEGHIPAAATDPPETNRSFWTGTYLKMRVGRPGVWFPPDVAGLTLVRPDTGLTIPYDTTGTAALGWSFATDSTYATVSATASQYVRVKGSAAQVNAQLQWIYHWNHIPTDLYYASLVGAQYGQAGTHDWDLSGNGLYGQHTNNTDLDGVAYRADLSVGRAPVASASQAAAFVDKVIAYESFQSPDGTPLEASWTRKLLFVSSNWGGRRWIAPSSAAPPGDWQYHHSPGDAHTVLHLKDAFETLEWRLLAQVAPDDVRQFPYKRLAGPSVRGWRYTVSGTDLSPSEVTISLFGMTFHIPVPTTWAVVYGQSAELSPAGFIFDHTNADGSLRDQEQLREQVAGDLPALNDVSRLYEDELDLTPAQAAAAPVAHLTAERLQDALNDGQHIVSLSGHGSPNGCCGLSIAMAGALTNGKEPFIGYADSCLTSQFDAEDAVSEHLLYNPNGGAVAYIGNARFSWIGVGDNFQRRFFERLQTTRHLGLLNDTRCAMVSEATGFWPLYNKWAIFSLNLMGDPEMPVWSSPPHTMKVHMLRDLDRRNPFVVIVSHRRFGLDLPLPGAVVTIQQGSFSRTASTDGIGTVSFDVAEADLGELTVTITKLGYRPVLETVDIVGPAWVTGVVRVVAHQHPTPHQTLVELELETALAGDARRGWLANDDAADYRIILDAVTDAYISGEAISLYVGSIKEHGTIERFRFGAFPLVIAARDLRRERLAMPGHMAGIPEQAQPAPAPSVVDLREEEPVPTVPAATT